MRCGSREGDQMDEEEFPGLSEKELRELARKYARDIPVMAIASGAAGSGKTMLTAHLAIQAVRAGAGPVVVMDTVSRGAYNGWWNRRKAEKPAMASTGGASRFKETLSRLGKMGAKLCLIDTAPVMDSMVEQVIAASSVVVVPCRPDPKDLFAADATFEVAQILGRKSVFVINSAVRQARMTEAITVELAKHGTVAPVTIYRRPEYVEAMAAGLTVMENENARDQAAEIEKLWEYLYERLNRVLGL
jgi:chromosome partitioning protein